MVMIELTLMISNDLLYNFDWVDDDDFWRLFGPSWVVFYWVKNADFWGFFYCVDDNDFLFLLIGLTMISFLIFWIGLMTMILKVVWSQLGAVALKSGHQIRGCLAICSFYHTNVYKFAWWRFIIIFIRHQNENDDDLL